MAHLEEQLLPIIEKRGSNPVIGDFLKNIHLVSNVLKENDTWNWSIF